MSYDQASAIMTNTYLDSIESEDGYYLFSEGMEERYGRENIDSELSGGTNEELIASNQADASVDEDRNNFDGSTAAVETVDTDSQPTGGFPPIYIVTKKVMEQKKDTKSRELSTRSSAVSIMDILKKKKVEASE
jgi:hypothetical protein